MAIVETLMQSSEPALNLMASRLHCAMFDNFDRFFQQVTRELKANTKIFCISVCGQKITKTFILH
jgi:hypothetical protein